MHCTVQLKLFDQAPSGVGAVGLDLVVVGRDHGKVSAVLFSLIARLSPNEYHFFLARLIDNLLRLQGRNPAEASIEVLHPCAKGNFEELCRVTML